MPTRKTPKKFRYGVLGGGMQGSAAGFDLLRKGKGESVVFFDKDESKAKAAAARVNKLLGGKKASARVLDVSATAEAAQAFKGLDGVLSAAPYPLNPGAADAAVRAGACFCDLGGNTDVVRATLRLDAAAKRAGVSVVPDCGLAPGLGNTLAAYLVETSPWAREIRIRCGGLPQKPKPPLDYMLLFNIGGLTNEYSGEAEFLRAGRLERVPTLTEIEDVTIFGVGRLEAAVTSGGTSLAPETFRGKLDVYDYKTLRYRGHFAKVAAMKALGMFDLDRVTVEGGRVRPRDVFEAVAAPKLVFKKDKDLVVLRVEATSRGARPKKRTITLIDRFNPGTGFTAMERTTAFPAAAMLHLQVQGLIAPGATTPERGVPFESYLAAVKARGLRIRTT